MLVFSIHLLEDKYLYKYLIKTNKIKQERNAGIICFSIYSISKIKITIHIELNKLLVNRYRIITFLKNCFY